MRKTILLLAFYAIATISFGQYSWINKNQFSGAARSKSASFVVNGKGYSVGGRVSSSPLTYVKDVWEYNPATDSWTAKASYPFNIVQPFSFAIGNKGYIAGGGSDNNLYQPATYEFDPTLNTWTQKADYPENAGGGFQFVIGGKAYVGGGARNSTMGATMYEYTPGTNTWVQKADYPGTPAANQVGFSVGNFGYAGLGTNGQGVSYNEMYKYNPSNNQWSAIATFPGKERFGAVAFVLDGHAFVGGGARLVGSNYISLNDFYEYDPIADLWSPAPGIPGFPKAEVNSFVIDQSAYLFNGWDYDGGQFFNQVFEFGSCGTISSLFSISSDDTQALFLYPNPSQKFISVNISASDMNSQIYYEIISIDGRLISSSNSNTREFQINTESLSNGSYLLSVNNGLGKQYTQKFEVMN